MHNYLYDDKYNWSGIEGLLSSLIPRRMLLQFFIPSLWEASVEDIYTVQSCFIEAIKF